MVAVQNEKMDLAQYQAHFCIYLLETVDYQMITCSSA